MSISSRIAPHLPYLRRFARAISGSQASGDSYVAMTLEALIADPASFPEDMQARPALYRTFLKLWNSIGANQFPDFNSDNSDAVQGLQTLTPRPRQAFVLLTIEGFQPEDIAQILETTVDEVGALVAEADQEIAEQLPAARIMIIEDEPLVAADLEALVESLGHDVTGIASTHRAAVDLTHQEMPELILSDVQLEDGSSGLEAVNEILGEINVPVIFITAHPELLLTGDKPEPAFIIPKPFHPETVKAVVSQALFFNMKSALAQADELRVGSEDETNGETLFR